MTGRFRLFEEGRVLHQDPWLTVREYTVERGGVGATYSVVERPDSIVVIPLTPTHRTVLLKQFRFPTQESSWELPMGGVNDSEAPDAAAGRELFEEVGLVAADLVKVGEYRAAPGLTPQRVTVFVGPVTDEAMESAVSSWSGSDEIQDVRIVTLNELIGMAGEGGMTDGFSLAGLLLLRLWLERQAR